MQKQQIAASYQNFHVIAHDLDETEDFKTKHTFKIQKEIGKDDRTR